MQLPAIFIIPLQGNFYIFLPGTRPLLNVYYFNILMWSLWRAFEARRPKLTEFKLTPKVRNEEWPSIRTNDAQPWCWQLCCSMVNWFYYIGKLTRNFVGWLTKISYTAKYDGTYSIDHLSSMYNIPSLSLAIRSFSGKTPGGSSRTSTTRLALFRFFFGRFPVI